MFEIRVRPALKTILAQISRACSKMVVAKDILGEIGIKIMSLLRILKIRNVLLCLRIKI